MTIGRKTNNPKTDKKELSINFHADKKLSDSSLVHMYYDYGSEKYITVQELRKTITVP